MCLPLTSVRVIWGDDNEAWVDAALKSWSQHQTGIPWLLVVSFRQTKQTDSGLTVPSHRVLECNELWCLTYISSHSIAYIYFLCTICNCVCLCSSVRLFRHYVNYWIFMNVPLVVCKCKTEWLKNWIKLNWNAKETWSMGKMPSRISA